jgi:Grap2 and cyclin-D-interacting
MSSPTDVPGAITISTTIALIEQFLSNLSPNASHNGTPCTSDSPSPLLLLNASAKTIKTQVTKLSLLTVTTPFTPSAIGKCLKPLNDSILPSLVTAALLTTPEAFTPSFSIECLSLARAVLRDILALSRQVEARSNDGQPSKEPSDTKKKEITEATGRVWENCDEIVSFSDAGLPGFVVRKSQQWLELMKDAVKELTEWDPEDEGDADDIFGDARSDDSAHEQSESEKQQSADRATISTGVKDQALKVLSRIPQSMHVVIKQRLAKWKPAVGDKLPPSTRSHLDLLLTRTRNVSELIDEAAEAMYMGDLELCLKKAGEARAHTTNIVESVLQPLDSSPGTDQASDTPEDRYIKRALEWTKQVGIAARADTS